MQSVQHSGQAFQVTEIEQGVFQVHFDLKSASVNVFNHMVFAELTTVLEQLEKHWELTFAAIEQLETEIGYRLRTILGDAVNALEAEGFAARLTRASLPERLS